MSVKKVGLRGEGRVKGEAKEGEKRDQGRLRAMGE